LPTDIEWLMEVERRLQPDGDALWWERLRPELARAVRGIERPVVLDVGCGHAGGMRVDLEGRPGLRLGLDLDPDGARNPDLDRFVRASTTRLPLREACADLIVSGYMIEHLPDPAAAFREFARVLKPGGRAALWTSNLLNYSMLASALTPTSFHNWVRRKSFDTGGKDNCGTFYRANTAGALVRALRAAGLEVEGGVRYGGGAYHYFRFSKPLFYAAALASRIATRTPLYRFKNVLLVWCVKPAAPGSAATS
jgi:SAM-dependent methyltransferase